MKHIIKVRINGTTKLLEYLTEEEKKQLDSKIIESFKQIGLMIPN